jgi:seryl-tRNA synthetase
MISQTKVDSLTLPSLILAARFDADQINRQINAIQKQIGELMKAKKANETEDLKKQKTELEEKKLQMNKDADAKEVELFRKAAQIGNMVHDTVPDSQTEDDNAIIRMFWPEGRSEEAERKRRVDVVGSATVKDGAKGVKGLRSHHEVFDMIDGFDNVRGVLFARRWVCFVTDPVRS